MKKIIQKISSRFCKLTFLWVSDQAIYNFFKVQAKYKVSISIKFGKCLLTSYALDSLTSLSSVCLVIPSNVSRH